jgi:hypothetical protein
MLTRWEGTGWGGRVFAPGTRMAVHRADQTGGQGIRDGYPAGVGSGGLSHIPSQEGSGQRDRQKFPPRRPSDSGAVIIPEWLGGIILE